MGAQSAEELEVFLDFLKSMCRLLIECGCSSNRVENLCEKLGAAFNMEIEALAIPTGVWLSVRKNRHHTTDLVRIKSWSVNLTRLSQVNDLVEKISANSLDIHAATIELKKIQSSSDPFKPVVTTLASGGASAVLVFLYGGIVSEIVIAFFLGVFVDIFNKYATDRESRRYLADFLSAALTTLLCVMASHLLPGLNMPRLIIGGIILMVPGLVLVNAVHEIAQKNLVSGTARLVEALMISASLASGVILVIAISQTMFS